MSLFSTGLSKPEYDAEKMRLRLLGNEANAVFDENGGLKRQKETESIILNRDIIEMMTNNLKQIEDYYIISKTNAKRAFTLALLFCILGFALFASAVIIAFTVKLTDFAVISTIGGAISQILAATALLVHSGAQKQLNYYYEALHENEQFLSAVHLVSKISPDKPDKQDETYISIIKNSLDILTDKNKKKEPVK